MLSILTKCLSFPSTHVQIFPSVPCSGKPSYINNYRYNISDIDMKFVLNNIRTSFACNFVGLKSHERVEK